MNEPRKSFGFFKRAAAFDPKATGPIFRVIPPEPQPEQPQDTVPLRRIRPPGPLVGNQAPLGRWFARQKRTEALSRQRREMTERFMRGLR